MPSRGSGRRRSRPAGPGRSGSKRAPVRAPRRGEPPSVIRGLGMDLVEIARIARILEGPTARAERFLARCFTSAERDYCEGRRDRAGRYAARFAAKEAVIKALGAPPGVSWRELEVERGEGAPSLRLAGEARAAADRLGVVRVHLTMTHDAGVAGAVVVLEGGAR